MTLATRFLISPANTTGARAASLIAGTRSPELFARLNAPDGVPIGEVFSKISTTYFRGKLEYAQTFADARSLPVLILTPGVGLVAPERPIGRADLALMAHVAANASNDRFVRPLESDLRTLHNELDRDDRVVFLGSLAPHRYLPVLGRLLNGCLFHPVEFEGRGEMSRGRILLDAIASGNELDYVATKV